VIFTKFMVGEVSLRSGFSKFLTPTCYYSTMLCTYI